MLENTNAGVRERTIAPIDLLLNKFETRSLKIMSVMEKIMDIAKAMINPAVVVLCAFSWLFDEFV